MPARGCRTPRTWCSTRARTSFPVSGLVTPASPLCSLSLSLGRYRRHRPVPIFQPPLRARERQGIARWRNTIVTDHPWPASAATDRKVQQLVPGRRRREKVHQCHVRFFFLDLSPLSEELVTDPCRLARGDGLCMIPYPKGGDTVADDGSERHRQWMWRDEISDCSMLITMTVSCVSCCEK